MYENIERELGIDIENKLTNIGPGEEITYHTGYLAHDIGDDKAPCTPQQAKIRRISETVRRLHIKGVIEIIQKINHSPTEKHKKLFERNYDYIAIGLKNIREPRKFFYTTHEI